MVRSRARDFHPRCSSSWMLSSQPAAQRRAALGAGPWRSLCFSGRVVHWRRRQAVATAARPVAGAVIHVLPTVTSALGQLMVPAVHTAWGARFWMRAVVERPPTLKMTSSGLRPSAAPWSKARRSFATNRRPGWPPKQLSACARRPAPDAARCREIRSRAAPSGARTDASPRPPSAASSARARAPGARTRRARRPPARRRHRD